MAIHFPRQYSVCQNKWSKTLTCILDVIRASLILENIYGGHGVYHRIHVSIGENILYIVVIIRVFGFNTVFSSLEYTLSLWVGTAKPGFIGLKRGSNARLAHVPALACKLFDSRQYLWSCPRVTLWHHAIYINASNQTLSKAQQISDRLRLASSNFIAHSKSNQYLYRH